MTDTTKRPAAEFPIWKLWTDLHAEDQPQEIKSVHIRADDGRVYPPVEDSDLSLLELSALLLIEAPMLAALEFRGTGRGAIRRTRVRLIPAPAIGPDLSLPQTPAYNLLQQLMDHAHKVELLSIESMRDTNKEFIAANKDQTEIMGRLMRENAQERASSISEWDGERQEYETEIARLNDMMLALRISTQDEILKARRVLDEERTKWRATASDFDAKLKEAAQDIEEGGAAESLIENVIEWIGEEFLNRSSSNDDEGAS